MKKLIVVLIILAVYINSAIAKEVDKLTVKGATIRVGQLSDDVGPILVKLHKYKVNHQITYSDPQKPWVGNLTSTKENYKVGNKKFSIVISRVKDPGPFRITKIITDEK